jgi:hypothetical protein
VQSVEPQADQCVIRRTLLATGLGAALGLQGWRLAVALSVPWYGAVWVWLGHLFLGVSVGMTAGIARWWKRGIGLGLAFGMASGFGALVLGMNWVPFGVVSITASVVSGLLTALIADAVFPIALTSANSEAAETPEAAVHGYRGVAGRSEPAIRVSSDIGRRLAREAAELDDLESERRRRRKPGFGKVAEDRIVWGELLELELQDLDERLEQTGREADNPAPQRPRTP